MNQKTVAEMGNIMGDVIAIEPPTGLPATGEVFKVCVNISLTTPLRRGVLAITVAKTTRCIRYFYEKQPHKIYRDCFILEHSKIKCEDMASHMEALHKKPIPFSVKLIKKQNPMLSRSNVPILRKSTRRPARTIFAHLLMV